MTDGQQTIQSAISEAERLRKVIGSVRSAQIRSAEYKQIIKATSLAWFNRHRPIIVPFLSEDDTKPIDELYRALLAATAHATLRSKYLIITKEIKRKLATLEADHVLTLSQPLAGSLNITSDSAPDFSSLISDAKMQLILRKRWDECGICIRAYAPLAATVMMGGLLEGLLLAKINSLVDKTQVFSASASPKDTKTGKALQLKDWGLKNFIDVAHELRWISKTTKDVGGVLRDYRNYIHPQKELSHGIVLEPNDAQMLWEVAKSITLQLLKT